MKNKDKKIKRKLLLPQKIVLGVVAVIALVAIGWFTYYMIRFYNHRNYKNYLSETVVATAGEYAPLSDIKKDVKGMDLVAENDILKLYVDPKMGSFAIYDKRNGQTTYSNPPLADEDTIANETNKNYLKSQFVINYFNKAKAMGTYDSYSMAVAREQIKVESIDNGVRFTYTLGDFSSNDMGLTPDLITQEKLDEVCAKLIELGQESDAKALTRYYSATDEATGMIALLPTAKKNAKTIRKISGIFESAGFTKEDLADQMQMAGVEVTVPMSFVIALDYTLDNDGVNVTVPTKLIEENGGGSLYRIRLLGFFDAAGADEEGYFVVPNGSGSIIYFNNGKNHVETYSQYIYDLDPLSADYTQLENTQKIRLPLCGICKDKTNVLMTVEEGQTLAFFTAGVGGTTSTYNYINTSFVFRGYDLLAMFGSTGNEADLPLLEKQIYDVNFTVKYTLLDENHTGYSGIANYYRERLINEGVLTKQTKTGDIPFYYDIIGGVKETANLAGIRYLKVLAMTTFDEASEIAIDLKNKGISYQVMNFSGWSNGGYYADAYNKITKLGNLGGKKKLEALNDTLEEMGGRLYVDVPFQKVTKISKRYSEAYETARYYGAGYIAQFGLVGPTSYRKTSSLGYNENMFNLISPKFLDRYVGGFAKSISKIDVGGIGLRDLGDELHSDKKRTELINREEALDVVLAQFETLENTGKNMMITGGNAYSLAYATDILEAPLKHNSFRIIDEEIPLYEMIIHGYIDYTGTVLNFNDAANKNKIILRLVEYGASPRYMFTKENASEMKYTALNKFYATTYENWCDEAVETYNAVNKILKYVSGAAIVKHEILDNGVRKVTYSNGEVIYINYSGEEKSADGIVIPAVGCRRGGAE